MSEPKDVTVGLRMMAGEFRRNAEQSTSPRQQDAFSGRAMIAEGGANEITRLRKRIEELEEALRPFAELPDDDHILAKAYLGQTVDITAAEIIRARAAQSASGASARPGPTSQATGHFNRGE